MEIRNCEEYVIARLESVENELEVVKEENAKLKRAIEILSPHISTTHTDAYSVDTAFLWTDREDLRDKIDELVEILGLEYPTKE